MFFRKKKRKKEMEKLKKENIKHSEKIEKLSKRNTRQSRKITKQDKRIKDLEKRSDEKDIYFKELMSDATRHGSSLGAKHMSDRKKYKQGK